MATAPDRAARTGRTNRQISHKMMGGKLNLCRRERSRFWQASTCLKGHHHRTSTKEESLARAKEFAEDWFLELTARARTGTLHVGKSFAEVAKLFIREYETMTVGHRSPKWVRGHKDRIRLHLDPFFGSTPVKAITGGMAQEYRVQRATKPDDWDELQAERVAQGKEPREWKPPARNTIHNEVVTLSLVLKTALRHGWIDYVPDLSDPYRRRSKVEHRPWFTQSQYKTLYEATRKLAAGINHPLHLWHAEQLHDFVLFMANTGLRPDEANHVEFRDVEIVTDEWSGEEILEIEVRGKRGVGYCKSMPGAVRPFQRLSERPRPLSAQATPQSAGDDDEDAPVYRPPGPMDKLFPSDFKRIFNRVLTENNLKEDRAGKGRTAYSLRHSYICFRLLEGADIYQIAKNCRTSVEMIEKHYAAHLKDMIDTSLVNVRRRRAKAHEPKRNKDQDEGEGSRPDA
ncbi:MAG: site-specific integrase [Pseudomonadota bacterium]